MLKSLSKKAGLVVGMLALTAGVAFAAFTLTFNVNSGNTVTAASTGLQITSTPVNMTGLVAGGSTEPKPIKIKNVGGYSGTVKLNLIAVTGSLCPELKLTIAGDEEAVFDPIANGTAVLGTLAPGAEINLTQVVTMDDPSTQFGSSCGWSMTATFTDQ